MNSEAKTATDAPGTASELMDAIYGRQRFIYDLTRKYYLLGRDRLIEGLAPGENQTVLELGCGTGRNLIAVARRYPKARCYGLDLSAEMLKTARSSVERNGLGERIRLARADATAFDAATLFGIGRFDRVFVSYSLSMIPGWRDVLGAGLDAATQGGSLHVVDFGMQERLPSWFGDALHAWLDRFHVTPRPDMEEAMAQTAAERGARLEFSSLYRDYARYGVIRLP